MVDDNVTRQNLQELLANIRINRMPYPGQSAMMAASDSDIHRRI
jgi:hypothetical protein